MVFCLCFLSKNIRCIADRVLSQQKVKIRLCNLAQTQIDHHHYQRKHFHFDLAMASKPISLNTSYDDIEKDTGAYHEIEVICP